jgi:enoyl-CoA hydratase
LIQVAQHDRVTVITLNRPAKRNALNVELCHRIREGVTSAVSEGARAIVLTGAGTSFCAGADLGEVYGADFRAALYAMLDAVTNAPVPVVAAVNGPAIGGGTQLAIAADLRVVAPGARFAVPTAKLGLATDPWTIRRLALLAGNGTARAMLLACDELDADAARRCGLAERTGTPQQAIDWAASMTPLAPLSIAYAKQVLNAAFEPPLQDAALDAAYEACWTSADFAEGRRARAEKRPPVFEGR